MIATTLAQAARWCGGRLEGADRSFEGVSTDTRTLQGGQLFVALQGERFDGHEYLDVAASAGASGALVHRAMETSLSRVRVGDTRRSLGQLAASWRDQLGGRIIALTGSSGKTTVKEMLAAILGRCGVVSATRGNLNNDIGLPLTLLEAAPEDDYLVLEMGANAPGDVAYLIGLARPHVSLLNNAGPAHLEGFGSVAGVAAAKGEILTGLDDTGIAVFNGDDPHASLWREQTGNRSRIEFGFAADRDVRGEILDPARRRVCFEVPGTSFELTLPLPGTHNVMNALAATAGAVALGIGADEIRAGLESISPVPGRLQRVPGRHGATLVDDTYNANPLSLKAGLEALSLEPGSRWLVLGDMKELGPQAADMHREAGQAARNFGCQRLYTFGDLAASAAEGFGSGAESYGEIEALCAALDAALEDAPGRVTVLVKGSRAMRLERVIAYLAESEERG